MPFASMLIAYYLYTMMIKKQMVKKSQVAILPPHIPADF